VPRPFVPIARPPGGFLATVSSKGASLRLPRLHPDEGIEPAPGARSHAPINRSAARRPDRKGGLMSSLPNHATCYTTGRLAPYLRAMRPAGNVATLLEASQPAGDMSGPPHADLLIVRAMTDGIRHRSDLGAGRFAAVSPVGELFLIAPATSTDVQVQNPHVVRGYAFSAARLRPLLEVARPGQDPFDFGPLHARGFRDAHMLALLDRLWEEAGHGDAAGQLYAEGAAITLLGMLLRVSDGMPVPAPRGGLAPWQLRRVQAAIEERLAEDVSLTELAGLVDLSPWHFCRAFRRSTGQPPHRWRQVRRIARACTMLSETNLPISAVAAATGHADPGQFATLFRKIMGCSPSTWRRERRE
jgi:AraC family transcriptional regulator